MKNLVKFPGVGGSAHAINGRSEASGVGGGSTGHVLQSATEPKSIGTGRPDGHLLLSLSISNDQLHAAEPETEGCGGGRWRCFPTGRRYRCTQPPPASAAESGGSTPTREDPSAAAADARTAGTCLSIIPVLQSIRNFPVSIGLFSLLFVFRETRESRGREPVTSLWFNYLMVS